MGWGLLFALGVVAIYVFAIVKAINTTPTPPSDRCFGCTGCLDGLCRARLDGACPQCGGGVDEYAHHADYFSAGHSSAGNTWPRCTLCGR